MSTPVSLPSSTKVSHAVSDAVSLLSNPGRHPTCYRSPTETSCIGKGSRNERHRAGQVGRQVREHRRVRVACSGAAHGQYQRLRAARERRVNRVHRRISGSDTVDVTPGWEDTAVHELIEHTWVQTDGLVRVTLVGTTHWVQGVALTVTRSGALRVRHPDTVTHTGVGGTEIYRSPKPDTCGGGYLFRSTGRDTA